MRSIKVFIKDFIHIFAIMLGLIVASTIGAGGTMIIIQSIDNGAPLWLMAVLVVVWCFVIALFITTAKHLIG